MTPNYQAFMGALEKHAKMMFPAAHATVEANQDLCGWVLNPLARWASAAYGEHAFEDAVKGYARYCMGVWKAQQLYEKAGRFTPHELPEIMTNVYADEGYMVPYMWAAILIYPFWQSMTAHIAMYRDQFVKALPPQANVLELACGHGVLSLLAAEERKDIRSHGVDISPSAIKIADRLLGVSGHGERVRFEVKDALKLESAGPARTYQGIVAAMLAEHLEDPRPLFRALAHHLSDNGLVFFSTALESAQRDHVYEYHHESEVIKMAEEVGLRVTRLVCDSNSPPPGARFLPRALGMILRRR